MKKYDLEDHVTFYFIILDDGRNSIVKAWTDQKEYAKAYLEFHKCKNFHLKVVNNTFREILPFINENTNDEIGLVHMIVRNPKPKKGAMTKIIMVPLTTTENTFVNEEVNTFLASRINYTYAFEAMPYLKKKYQKALEDIFFKDVVHHVTGDLSSPFVESVELDELLILFRSFPDWFG